MSMKLLTRLAACLFAVGCSAASCCQAQSFDPLLDGRPLSTWVDRIDDSNLEVRRAASQKIALLQRWHYKSPVGVSEARLSKLLAALSQDPDLEVRRNVALGIGGLEATEKITDALRRCLQDPDRSVRCRAASSIVMHPSTSGDQHPKDVLDVLMAALEGADPELQEIAAEGLSLVKVHEEHRPAIYRQLHSPNAKVRAAMTGACVRLGAEANTATPMLAKLLGDSAPSVRAGAASGLKAIGRVAATATPGLIDATRDEVSFVRQAAAEALGSVIGDGSAGIAALCICLQDKDPSVRSAAAQSLGNFAPNAIEAVRPLTSALQDDSPAVFTSAAKSLGRFGTAAKSATPILLERARSTLEAKDPYFDDWIVAVFQIDPQSKEASVLLATALKSANGAFRYHALRACRDIGNPAKVVLPELIELLRSQVVSQPDGNVVYVSMALSSIGKDAKPAVPALREIYLHSPRFQSSVMKALEVLDPETAEELKKNPTTVRLTAGVVSITCETSIGCGEKCLYTI